MFNEKDKAMLNGLNKLLDEATFPLKKREVMAFASIVKWLQELEIKIDANIKSSKTKSKEK